MATAREIIELLELVPLTIEGGCFRETYRAPISINSSALPAEYSGDRNASTAFSAIHRVKSDEIFHFYAGDPVEMLELHPDGTARTVIISNDLAAGHKPQHVVSAGVWQGCRLAPGGKNWALMGCTVAPGFDYADFELAERAPLIAAHPKHAKLIKALTRD